jgi:hypothetical protein
MNKLMCGVIAGIVYACSADAQVLPSPEAVYSYDASGNRIKRTISYFSTGRKAAENDPLLKSSIVLSPNPTSSLLNVKMENTDTGDPAELYLYDTFGKLVLSTATTGNLTPVDLSGYAPGTYILKLKRNDSELTWKVIKAD